ncbi:DoxX family protein [Ktedonospora formicarum]|uniref:DoxX family protein n=1 Tax=Ktedonospora formicarum TaxID=2778364 RepID=A0A8J3HX79_9CHLR|nr:DoxX family protein [Ktedonospora formicarum]GHO45797.1 hypothetical protein KSX_39600 [Ktedonospora formicarum]
MQNLTINRATSKNNSKAQHGKVAMSIGLWAVQVLVALIFLFSGSSKLIMPIEMMTTQMAIPLPGLFIRFLGVAEVAGALGLILPGLFRIQRILTPLAAAGLIIIMIGATTITLASGDSMGALMPLVLGLLAALILYGRRSYLKTA